MLMKTADPTGTTKIVRIRVMAVVGVGMVTKSVRFRVADPEVMTVVKRVAVTAVRHVVVTVGSGKMAERAERVIRRMRMVPVVPDRAAIARRLRRTREDCDAEASRRRFVARVSVGIGLETRNLGRRRNGIATRKESRDQKCGHGARCATKSARHMEPPGFAPMRCLRHRTSMGHLAASAQIWDAFASDLLAATDRTDSACS